MGKPSTTSTATRPQFSAAAAVPAGISDPKPSCCCGWPQTGDRDAFAELYRAFADNVCRYVAARMRHRDPEAVADLVQDTFAGALTELDRTTTWRAGSSASPRRCAPATTGASAATCGPL